MLSAATIEGHLCVGMYFSNGGYFNGFTTMYEDWSFERVVSTFEECFDAWYIWWGSKYIRYGCGDSELYIATKEASDGSMTMSSNFDDIFEVSYFNKSGEYIGGFLINDEQYEELWEAEVIVDEFYLFLCD